MISGKSFSELCRWVVDPRYPHREAFHYGKAQSGDWVFVNGDFLYTLSKALPIFPIKRFVFVIHNTDRSFGEPELRTLLPHVLRIYAINTTIHHPNLRTIPIGFVDRQLPFLSTFQPTTKERNIEIYMNFTTVTNVQKRKSCAEAFVNDPRVVVREGLAVPDYYDDLCRSKFVLCPEGTGIDTHRVYESILCGATPVVLRNSLSHLYDRLPVCIVDKWTDPFYTPIGKIFHINVKDYINDVL